MPFIQTDRIDKGLKPGQNWTSPIHRVLAEFALGENPYCDTREKLQAFVSLINAIPKDEIHKATCKTLKDMGIEIP